MNDPTQSMPLDLVVKKYPKARPLAESLIAAAAEQGASVEETECALFLVKERLKEATSAVTVAKLLHE